jgi:hypothetical protein
MIRTSVMILAVVMASSVMANAPMDAPKPVLRPDGLAVEVRLGDRPHLRPVQLAGLFKKKNRIKGSSVCGQRDIIGTVAAPVRTGRCGIDNPVRVTSVAGVYLNSPALVDCKTAQALSKWVDKAAMPALKRKGGGLKSLNIVASYACRTRNSQKGAKLSEHAQGHAVDIAGFTLHNGQKLTVLKDWNGKHSKALRSMHKKACGTFGTVLGPKADKYHLDHFHFDTARYRNGAYCR